MVFVLTAFVNMAGVVAATRKMSNVALALILFVGSIFSEPLYAQMTLHPLSGAEIRQTMFGQTMTGEYSDGSRWAERFNSDGTSDYSQNARTVRGQMTLNGNILCFIYLADKQTGGCFEVWRRGLNCFDFYSASGDASLDQRRFGRGWDARAWYVGKPSTCLSEHIS